MEMTYTICQDYTIRDLEFAGLTGNERVFSVKEALTYLTITNPSMAFAEAVKEGVFNELTDNEYENLLSTTRCIAGLFRYDDTEETMLAEMNVLMLLRNAITQLVKQDVTIRQMIGAIETELKQEVKSND